MKLRITLPFIFSFFLLLISCEKDEIEKASIIPTIKEFKFEAVYNSGLSEDIYGVIDPEEKVINVTFPALTSLSNLNPTISVSEGISITPNTIESQDFSSPKTYTLSGEGYTTTTYTVKASVQKSDVASIISFNFLTSNNPQLEEAISTEIEGNTIKVQVSDAIDLSALVPSIELSQGASITPDQGQAMDFTQEVKFMVTAQDGITKAEYTIVFTTLNSDKKIKSFGFNIDDILYQGDIDHNSYEISVSLPYNTGLRSLVPIIEISEGSSISPLPNTAQDFTQEITYEVVAEDGSTQEYKVNVSLMKETSLENDRAVLEEFYTINKAYNTLFTYLDWDLDAESMEEWQGVTITDGRVTKLIISTIYVNEIPQSFGELSELTSLTIVGTDLKELPKEVCDLKKLEILSLYDNKLSSIPSEIGKLQSLMIFHLQYNELTALPREIGDLNNLLSLSIQNNNINELPNELVDLPRLLTLNIQNNPVINIPPGLCDKKNEINNLNIVITKDEEDVCN
ncbi:DUF5018 domain-containing protein [Flammeovirga sp. OC4]|uniref:DUF5018 domain-containing protein n=1 Tax=Flammeovirga sp. OC4 TaxID=1382345 RepID=UPI000693BE8E|nr:DUF5018 domain-containing protein [Flammeovirga sp. OC4]